MFGGGVERAEQLHGHRFRDARAAVQHVDHRLVLHLEDAQADARRFTRQAPVVQRVLHQHGQHLLQVALVHQRRHRLGADDRFQAVGLDGHGLLVVLHEAAHVGVEVHVFRAGALAAGQAQHAFHDAVGALALLVDDLQQAAVAVDDAPGFFQQLDRVIDGGQRVADFMGQAGGEATQRGEGQRFGAARDHAGVVQEHQRQVAADQQAGETRLDLGLVGRQLQRGFVVGPAVAPLLQAAGQFRCDLWQVDAPAVVFAFTAVADQQRGGFVGQLDAVFGIHHQYPGAHAADDEFIDFEQVGHFHAALLGQRMAGARALADLAGQVAHGQVGGGVHDHFGHRTVAGGLAQHVDEKLDQHRRRRKRRDTDTQAHRQQQRRSRHVEQQHHGDAGGGFGQGVGDQYRDQDVHAGADNHQRHQPRLAAAEQQEDHGEGQVDPGDHGGQLRRTRCAEQARQRTEQQAGQDAGFQHPVQAEEIQLAPRSGFEFRDDRSALGQAVASG